MRKPPRLNLHTLLLSLLATVQFPLSSLYDLYACGGILFNHESEEEATIRDEED